ncbi:aspartic peptidase domain-containing protein [Thelonectria olida]|uniref:Aspartic peptidase domain-containing protein n=1 Tax=Thelonectria olida TaxID=1576542 RepID=A0A9P8W4Z3_9HYPO|nr:aspartic peptidase domain-containing protein [Thelonectria olida]
MRSSIPLLSLAASCVRAGTVAVGFSKQTLDHSVTITRRDNTLDLTALNNITGGGYYAEFSIGTPGQKLSFLLDTGSSDTWVNSVDTDLCNSLSLQKTNGFCMTQFDPDESSTYKVVDRNGFDITYLDGRRIRGDYFKDTVTIDGKQVKNQQLGLAAKSVRPTGIMGLGFDTNVAAAEKYPTILDNLVSQGVIDTAAFSLYLNDLDTDSGTVLFGGIDTKKFIGNLSTLPLVPDFQSTSNNITSFTVEMDSFSVTTKDGDDDVRLDNMNADAILDSGSTICLLPDSQVKDIYDAFDIRTIQGVSVPFVDCAYADSKGDGITFNFAFKGKTIKVPMDEMVVNSFASVQDQIMGDSELSQIFDGWKGACMFGIGSASDYGVDDSSFALLGDTFLRSAYVVYDLTNQQIGLAEANVNATGSDVVEFKAGDKDLPSVTGVDASDSSSDGNDNAGERLLAGPAMVASVFVAVGAAAFML